MSEYTKKTIRKLLAGYASLDEGQMPRDDRGFADYMGPRMMHVKSDKAPFEPATIAKCDIDYALRLLSHRERQAVVYSDILEWSVGNCAYLLDCEIDQFWVIEERAIEKMADILGGRLKLT